MRKDTLTHSRSLKYITSALKTCHLSDSFFLSFRFQCKEYAFCYFAATNTTLWLLSSSASKKDEKRKSRVAWELWTTNRKRPWMQKIWSPLSLMTLLLSTSSFAQALQCSLSFIRHKKLFRNCGFDVNYTCTHTLRPCSKSKRCSLVRITHKTILLYKIDQHSSKGLRVMLGLLSAQILCSIFTFFFYLVPTFLFCRHSHALFSSFFAW